MKRLAFLLPLLAIAACVSQTDADTDAADGDAETAPATAVGGKADDALGLIGTAYEMTSPTTYKAGDITNLEVYDDTWFVRGRCYHTSCSTWAAETQHWDTFTSSGHDYLRFYSFKKDADGNEHNVVADAYEVKKTSTGIKLRKTYTSRWITLAKRTDKQLCNETSGTWSDATGCDCGGYDQATGDQNMLAPGLGGCFLAPTGTEDSCDATHGDYTDDDATKIGTYCICQLGYLVTDTGCQKI